LRQLGHFIERLGANLQTGWLPARRPPDAKLQTGWLVSTCELNEADPEPRAGGAFPRFHANHLDWEPRARQLPQCVTLTQTQPQHQAQARSLTQPQHQARPKPNPNTKRRRET